MLASLSCAPGGWLAVVGRAASPSEKTARANIVSRLRDEVKRALRSALACAPPAPGPAWLGDSALMAWYRSLYAPRTGGAYDSHHRTAGIVGRTRRRGRVAARGVRAAADDAPPSRYFMGQLT